MSTGQLAICRINVEYLNLNGKGLSHRFRKWIIEILHFHAMKVI